MRDQRSLIAGLRQLLGVQEVLTAMMVIAAISGAIATWKATQIYARGERPYIGVESIKLGADNAGRPFVAVNYRDFGPVPAEEAVLRAWTTIDGELASYDPLKPGDPKVRLNLGVLSPQAPHLFAAYFRGDALPAIRAGKSMLDVVVEVSYRGIAGEPYCYQMNFRYFPPTETFDPAGGSSRCQRER